MNNLFSSSVQNLKKKKKSIVVWAKGLEMLVWNHHLIFSNFSLLIKCCYGWIKCKFDGVLQDEDRSWGYTFHISPFTFFGFAFRCKVFQYRVAEKRLFCWKMFGFFPLKNGLHDAISKLKFIFKIYQKPRINIEVEVNFYCNKSKYFVFDYQKSVLLNIT